MYYCVHEWMHIKSFTRFISYMSLNSSIVYLSWFNMCPHIYAKVTKKFVTLINHSTLFEKNTSKPLSSS